MLIHPYPNPSETTGTSGKADLLHQSGVALDAIGDLVKQRLHLGHSVCRKGVLHTQVHTALHPHPTPTHTRHRHIPRRCTASRTSAHCTLCTVTGDSVAKDSVGTCSNEVKAATDTCEHTDATKTIANELLSQFIPIGFRSKSGLDAQVQQGEIALASLGFEMILISRFVALAALVVLCSGEPSVRSFQ